MTFTMNNSEFNEAIVSTKTLVHKSNNSKRSITVSNSIKQLDTIKDLSQLTWD